MVEGISSYCSERQFDIIKLIMSDFLIRQMENSGDHKSGVKAQIS
jgi:hypothetical protein